ncbi:LysR family transcriptional regulator [Vibrio sp. VB16]|uniref:LysR family transcriptional regulator n=1 Tax=Vibrio sp. VB16 TaxID=2785746 RepID=UPI00189D205C|nr:LysR family transcriptional regulator [Vibrio sp. VB16]UGA55669.1 LysR family transcriptional regulator [Vibrio sp. VB16]
MSEQQRDLDFNLLKTFLEVYRLQSITLAAESLKMTQPGVSGALKRLQIQLGADLFIRKGRGIEPTNLAIQLASRVEPAMLGIVEAVSSIREFDISQCYTFHILVNEIALAKLQPLVEQDTSLENISIEFSMVPNDEESLMHSLSMQKADLAVDVNYPNLSSYKTLQVQADELVLIARNGHPRIQGVITQEQYYEEKHITFRMRRSNRYTADYFTKLPIQDRKISAECDSLLTMCALVSGSDCIGSTSRELAIRYADKFGLQVLHQPFETLEMHQYMTWHTRTDTNNAHQWLRQKVSEYMAS